MDGFVDVGGAVVVGVWFAVVVVDVVTLGSKVASTQYECPA